ncbi:MAG: adenylate/guanylate cyclase domain-containing protein [Alphaproteobacteria bacterium]|nr:adenylate/guanylate cyclase domain-containing protein [Alphaproteobacteria bacterium]
MTETSESLRAMSGWLVECAVVERPIGEILGQFAEKLRQTGIPVDRINCSTFQRHQIMGAVDTTWDSDTGVQETEFVPKAIVSNVNIHTTPVGVLALNEQTFVRHDLLQERVRTRFEMLEGLHARGFTDYFILKKSYGHKWSSGDFNSGSEGVYGAFATRRAGGFSEADIESIRSVWSHFALFLKSSTERMLSANLLEVYVGKLPAEQILSGMIEHGDGRPINCALWYCDLRSSTRLSTSLPSEQYLALLNHYFVCTAGAVIAKGGEVLKLIGDAVMAIFPFEPGHEATACANALSATREALARARALQLGDNDDIVAHLQFGFGLHMGKVVLGNVGIPERLDMTVTGPSANHVTRLEALTKPLALVSACLTSIRRSPPGEPPIGRAISGARSWWHDGDIHVGGRVGAGDNGCCAFAVQNAQTAAQHHSPYSNQPSTIALFCSTHSAANSAGSFFSTASA